MATNHVKWIGNATVVFNLTGATNVFARIDMITSIAQGYQAKHQMIAWLESTCALNAQKKRQMKTVQGDSRYILYTHNYNRKCTSNHWHHLAPHFLTGQRISILCD
jgi:hypothetical protein